MSVSSATRLRRAGYRQRGLSFLPAHRHHPRGRRVAGEAVMPILLASALFSSPWYLTLHDRVDAAAGLCACIWGSRTQLGLQSRAGLGWAGSQLRKPSSLFATMHAPHALLSAGAPWTVSTPLQVKPPLLVRRHNGHLLRFHASRCRVYWEGPERATALLCIACTDTIQCMTAH